MTATSSSIGRRRRRPAAAVLVAVLAVALATIIPRAQQTGHPANSTNSAALRQRHWDCRNSLLSTSATQHINVPVTENQEARTSNAPKLSVFGSNPYRRRA